MRGASAAYRSAVQPPLLLAAGRLDAVLGRRPTSLPYFWKIALGIMA